MHQTRQLRYDRAKLEQDLEAEGEAMVLRLQRQLALLQQQQTSGSITGASPSASPRVPTHSSGVPGDDVLRLENESLRERLAHAEQEFSKHALVASNYRRELVSLRNKLGLDTSDLTPLSSSPSASATHRDLSSSGASSIHDILASPDFHPQVQSWSQRSTGETTPSDRSYGKPH